MVEYHKREYSKGHVLPKMVYVSFFVYTKIKKGGDTTMTKEAALGYMVLAAQAAGLDAQTIGLLDGLMASQMGFYSEEEAEEINK